MIVLFTIITELSEDIVFFFGFQCRSSQSDVKVDKMLITNEISQLNLSICQFYRLIPKNHNSIKNIHHNRPFRF